LIGILVRRQIYGEKNWNKILANKSICRKTVLKMKKKKIILNVLNCFKIANKKKVKKMF